MDNLYLKEVELDDIDLLIEYNNDFKKHYPDMKFSINEDTFKDWYNKLKKTRESENMMHVFPFWLMKENKAIGLPILKTNIEANKEFAKYGGHISYVIAPSYRKQGYGTECLHLALEKCQEFGLKEVMLSCNDRNIGSSSIMENNYAVLKDTCIYNGKAFVGEFARRYVIDVEESLRKYGRKEPVKKATLKEICNLNRENLDDFLINHMQNEVGEETLRFSELIADINDIEDISNLYKIFTDEFKPDKNNEVEKFKRTTEEIVKSRICLGCNDAGLVLGTILRLKGIPTVFVSSGHIDWIKNLQEQNESAKSVRGHIFLEIYLNDKWYLFDSMAGKIYDNYDYTNLSLPNGYYAFRKTLNNYNFGAYTLKDNNQIMRETFKNFDLKEYNEPNYECIDLKEKSQKRR